MLPALPVRRISRSVLGQLPNSAPRRASSSSDRRRAPRCMPAGFPGRTIAAIACANGSGSTITNSTIPRRWRSCRWGFAIRGRHWVVTPHLDRSARLSGIGAFWTSCRPSASLFWSARSHSYTIFRRMPAELSSNASAASNALPLPSFRPRIPRGAALAGRSATHGSRRNYFRGSAPPSGFSWTDHNGSTDEEVGHVRSPTQGFME